MCAAAADIFLENEYVGDIDANEKDSDAKLLIEMLVMKIIIIELVVTRIK